jgi:hypothetical protein
MIYSLTIFILSCVGMLLMISIKLFELRAGRDFIFIRWRNKIDEVAHLWFSKTKIFISSKERNTIAFVKSLPVKALHVVSKIHMYMHKKYGKQIDMIKGRSIPANKGQVSFFVNSISEYKKEIKR